MKNLRTILLVFALLCSSLAWADIRPSRPTMPGPTPDAPTPTTPAPPETTGSCGRSSSPKQTGVELSIALLCVVGAGLTLLRRQPLRQN
jgi:hypothetical protein